MHLLERETHLASLTQYADDAREGSGRLVLIAGEAGVGKSVAARTARGRPAGRPVGVGRVRRAVHAAPARAACSTSPASSAATLEQLSRQTAPREQLFSALLAS